MARWLGDAAITPASSNPLLVAFERANSQRSERDHPARTFADGIIGYHVDSPRIGYPSLCWSRPTCAKRRSAIELSYVGGCDRLDHWCPTSVTPASVAVGPGPIRTPRRGRSLANRCRPALSRAYAGIRRWPMLPSSAGPPMSDSPLLRGPPCNRIRGARSRTALGAPPHHPRHCGKHPHPPNHAHNVRDLEIVREPSHSTK